MILLVTTKLTENGFEALPVTIKVVSILLLPEELLPPLFIAQ